MENKNKSTVEKYDDLIKRTDDLIEAGETFSKGIVGLLIFAAVLGIIGTILIVVFK